MFKTSNIKSKEEGRKWTRDIPFVVFTLSRISGNLTRATTKKKGWGGGLKHPVEVKKAEKKQSCSYVKCTVGHMRGGGKEGGKNTEAN